MSSHQHSDLHFAQLQALLTAPTAGSQTNFGGGFRNIDGMRQGLVYNGELDQLSRSSIPVGRPPSATESVDHILRVIAQADQNALMRSGNEAYMRLAETHNGTLEELASLKRTFDVLVRVHGGPIPQAHDNQVIPTLPSQSPTPTPAAAQSVPAAPAANVRLLPTGIPRRTAYRREDVPLIKYWTRKQFDDAMKRASSNVVRPAEADSSLPFMEHEDGTPISEEEAGKIRQTARGIFAHLLRENSAPEKWGQVSVVSQDFFFNVLAERFPFAAMCEDMWKMQLLATICYPSWRRNNKNKIDRQRQDPALIDQLQGRQLKEEVIEQVELAVKRMRSMEDVAVGSESSKASKKPRATPQCTTTEKKRGPLPTSTTPQPRSGVSRTHAAPNDSSSPLLSSSRDTIKSITTGAAPSEASQIDHVSRSAPNTTPSATGGCSPADGTQTSNDFEMSPVSAVQRVPDSSSSSLSPTSPPSSSGSPVTDEQSQQAYELPILPPPSTCCSSVQNWAFDSSGLDTTHAHDIALDRLTVHDSTPYLPSPFDEGQPSLDAMPPSTSGMVADPTPASSGEANGEARVLRHGDVSTPTSSPIESSNHAEPEASRHSSLTPTDSQSTGSEADSQDTPADASLHPHVGRRIRPTSQTPHPYSGSKGAMDFESTFVKNAAPALPVVRNPLSDLIVARVPSSNVVPDTLESTHAPEGSEKENEGAKPKGRGRPPAGKAINPDQLIKGTPASCTARNMFALEYKSKHNKHPTEGLWQSLSKTELERLELMGKEKKAAKTKSKSEAK